MNSILPPTAGRVADSATWIVACSAGNPTRVIGASISGRHDRVGHRGLAERQPPPLAEGTHQLRAGGPEAAGSAEGVAVDRDASSHWLACWFRGRRTCCRQAPCASGWVTSTARSTRCAVGWLCPRPGKGGLRGMRHVSHKPGAVQLGQRECGRRAQPNRAAGADRIAPRDRCRSGAQRRVRPRPAPRKSALSSRVVPLSRLQVLVWLPDTLRSTTPQRVHSETVQRRQRARNGRSEIELDFLTMRSNGGNGIPGVGRRIAEIVLSDRQHQRCVRRCFQIHLDRQSR
jgi:hypothetical protein